jgi:hypothetical protein
MSDWFETMEEHLWLLPVHRIQIRNEKGEEEARLVGLQFFWLPNKYNYLIVCWVIISLTIVTQQHMF